ncbi:MAG: hypothetical protein EBY28_15070 [Betaproteobacteria bacterium]|nr:hypothetical protein [Betaproteobacteria bacterium]
MTGERVPLSHLAAVHGPAAQGTLLVLLAAPCLLPMPGVGSVLGIGLALLALTKKSLGSKKARGQVLFSSPDHLQRWNGCWIARPDPVPRWPAVWTVDRSRLGTTAISRCRSCRRSPPANRQS